MKSDKFILPEEIKVSVVTENETQRALRAALMRLDGGRAWVKGDGTDEVPSVSGKFCAVQSVFAGDLWLTPYDALRAAARRRGYEKAWAFNDDPKTTWADMEAFFQEAITLAGQPQ